MPLTATQVTDALLPFCLSLTPRGVVYDLVVAAMDAEDAGPAKVCAVVHPYLKSTHAKKAGREVGELFAAVGRAGREAEQAERQARVDELDAREDAAVRSLARSARHLAAALGGRVVETELHRGAFHVMFGAEERRLSFAAPGLVELCVEVDRRRPLRERFDAPVAFTCTPRAYSLDSNAGLDACEAQGAALVEAARFGRALLALVRWERGWES